MILPDRLLSVRDALEKGEQVDWRKLVTLQALDLAIAGREFAQEETEFNTLMDDLAVQSARGA